MAPTPEQQARAGFDRLLSLVYRVESEVDANLKRAQTLRQAALSAAFSGGSLAER